MTDRDLLALLRANYELLPHLDRWLWKGEGEGSWADLSSAVHRRIENLEVLTDKLMLEGAGPLGWPMSTSLALVQVARAGWETKDFRLPRPWEEALHLGLDVGEGEGFTAPRPGQRGALSDEDGDLDLVVETALGGLDPTSWYHHTVIASTSEDDLLLEFPDVGSAFLYLIETGKVTPSVKSPRWSNPRAQSLAKKKRKLMR